jgi:hypothetical protein
LILGGTKILLLSVHLTDVRAPTGAYIMKLEIVFEHKDTEQKQNYAYFTPKSKTYEVGVKEAEKYFNRLTRESGWTKKTTLKYISRLTNDQTEMAVVKVKTAPKKSRKRK